MTTGDMTLWPSTWSSSHDMSSCQPLAVGRKKTRGLYLERMGHGTELYNFSSGAGLSSRIYKYPLSVMLVLGLGVKLLTGHEACSLAIAYHMIASRLSGSEAINSRSSIYSSGLTEVRRQVPLFPSAQCRRTLWV